jgi:Amt family ammonium transporter
MVETVNNLWVLIAALLVFTMTISVGFLEIGELGEQLNFSLLKTILMTGAALVMAFVGFNTAFAPTVGGVIGHPFYSSGFFLGGFSSTSLAGTNSVWWSMRRGFFNTGLTPATYFLFETAFAAVTLALVGLVVLRKVKLAAFVGYAVVYFHPDLESAGSLDLEPDRLARTTRHGRLRRRPSRSRRRRRGRTGDLVSDLA